MAFEGSKHHFLRERIQLLNSGGKLDGGPERKSAGCAEGLLLPTAICCLVQVVKFWTGWQMNHQFLLGARLEVHTSRRAKGRKILANVRSKRMGQVRCSRCLPEVKSKTLHLRLGLPPMEPQFLGPHKVSGCWMKALGACRTTIDNPPGVH